MVEKSFPDAASDWANDLAYLADQQREIERRRKSEKFVSRYLCIPGNVPVTRTWTIADLPEKVRLSDQIRIVCVILLPANLCCRRCNCRLYWSFVGEPDLYRCSQCFPKPPKARQTEIDQRLAIKPIEFLVRHEWARIAELSTVQAGEPQKNI
jgi:hypothetical protein